MTSKYNYLTSRIDGLLPTEGRKLLAACALAGSLVGCSSEQPTEASPPLATYTTPAEASPSPTEASPTPTTTPELSPIPTPTITNMETSYHNGKHQTLMRQRAEQFGMHPSEYSQLSSQYEVQVDKETPPKEIADEFADVISRYLNNAPTGPFDVESELALQTTALADAIGPQPQPGQPDTSGWIAMLEQEKRARLTAQAQGQPLEEAKFSVRITEYVAFEAGTADTGKTEGYAARGTCRYTGGAVDTPGTPTSTSTPDQSERGVCTLTFYRNPRGDWRLHNLE